MERALTGSLSSSGTGWAFLVEEQLAIDAGQVYQTAPWLWRKTSRDSSLAKNRMTPASIFSKYAAGLRQFMAQSLAGGKLSTDKEDESFNRLALELFALQFEHNAAYRTWCDARRMSPAVVSSWMDIPALPASAFKELEVTSLNESERTVVFHSSGTTEHRPSRHYHDAESISLYEDSLVAWFRACLIEDGNREVNVLPLTPQGSLAPHSSLVHMFETLFREFGNDASTFLGGIDPDGAWSLEASRVIKKLQAAIDRDEPVIIMGTAFNFVHLLDQLSEQGKTLQLPAGSRVLETGGYKGRSRVVPKSELHQLIDRHLGIEIRDIICEYGMSELSSQAYDRAVNVNSESLSENVRQTTCLPVPVASCRLEQGAEMPREPSGWKPDPQFRFPPWARVRIVSSETGREVEDGQTGLIRVYDLANVRSVLAVQTEDLGIRRGDGFELLGRAVTAESRGCSLMVV